MVVSILADFSTEWSPHFGIELTLKAERRAVLNLEVVQPSMPRGLREYDKDAFEVNSFQCLAKPAGKIDARKLRAAKGEEMKIRNSNNGDLWQKLFAGQPVRDILPDFANNTSHEIGNYFTKILDEKV